MTSEQDIIEHCAGAGLTLVAASWRDELLLLRPASMANLPSPDQLAQIGEALKAQTGARWVAVDVDALAEAP